MKKILIILSLLFLSGCTTGEKMSSIFLGMNKNQVISILGNPDGAALLDNYELLAYSNRLISGWSYDKADYKLIFKDGKLIQYGPEKIRPDNGRTALALQQSLLIWQQQQALQNKSITTTNCTNFGNTVNCNTY
ncbi:hypothetical protein [Arsenophonus nasoniae]|uniref:Lipoprotein n=1 Tax=Arsenophonus nasoniae TaxID=638 RepID=A0AA95GH89_9GAMM|nr:hypothetical protein [Arsenophonus nasoniae]WGL96308.1 hypothetical protein QE207_07020 [Arsenophonus nasoniae]